MKKTAFLFFASLFFSFAKAQNYDVLTDIVERNPEYKIEEYFEIKNNSQGEPELIKVEKSILNGSAKEKRIYYKGTPYFNNQQWTRAIVKLPGQIPLEGFVSYNQVFQRLYFKNHGGFGAGTLIQPEYFELDSLTFTSYPEYDLLSYGFYTFTGFEKNGFSLLQRHDKLQHNNSSHELQGYIVDKDKYAGIFSQNPSFYLINGKKTLKVESKGYFIKQFTKDKKAVKQFVKDQKINFKEETDVIKFLEFLM
ncbi:hypothetical protein [Jiulongibacter sediminis]|uniref:YARHG domain-containing protein n=1 Tax=Jiulongibacter sediminis TaxID=1605367 RepID=A0A0P7C9I7_9BACT|nr:hypothetical protein [Jiulongibacter sediminis]KPM49153.1 hypothetical protein AFM12_00435 [Jiulongibacter sediminis]TBX26208.1 hypothetical protein TK44_00435 [Jiulongibacter sediminis]